MVRLRQEDLRKIRILHEDDDIVVVDKPAGLAVHGGADTKGRDLLAILEEAYPQRQALYLAHRLDRGTSGVLVVAKRTEVASALQGLWPSAVKRYFALAKGHLHQPRIVDTPLETRDGRKQRAQSKLTPLEAGPRATLVQVDITTGRQHQIRRHLAGIGHPVLMDDKYGDFAANKTWASANRAAGRPRPKHVMLHAARIEVPHPATGVPMVFEASLPDDWTGWAQV